MTKAGLQPGQVLLLTKPLGTGTLLAGAMKGRAKGRWLSGALQAMQVSSADASAVLRAHGCHAATDVTGFGLLGHVAEMARASQVRACSGMHQPAALQSHRRARAHGMH